MLMIQPDNFHAAYQDSCMKDKKSYCYEQILHIVVFISYWDLRPAYPRTTPLDIITDSTSLKIIIDRLRRERLSN